MHPGRHCAVWQTPKTMTVGFFAPMPPARNWCRRLRVESPRCASHSRRSSSRLRAAATSVNLYHLGNNGLHREIYFRALREPGVDRAARRGTASFPVGTLTRDQYLDEFRYNYGDWTEAWRRNFGAEEACRLQMNATSSSRCCVEFVRRLERRYRTQPSRSQG